MTREIQAIMAALNGIRVSAQPEESDIHVEICRVLDAANLAYTHEYKLGPGRRIDFFCGGVGIEVKKGRPAAARLRTQVEKYAESPDISALIIVAQRPCRLPERIGGKPVYLLSLDRLWGVALP